MRFRKTIHILFVICLLILPGVSSVTAKSSVNQLGKWTGKHTKMVWVQDHGGGTDALAHGNKLKLYGYDSKDGKGERLLVPQAGNFFKPFFTPDGSHVIVSNRAARQMYLIEWETGKVTELGAGVAVAAWQDPKRSLLLRKSTTWIYCFSGLQPENKYGTSQPLYRFPLDKPKKKELVWNQTNIAWSNLQLSRDGELIGGLFPWPHGGVLWNKDKRWQRLGRGCWTSLSPDNSKLFWIFDGLHRNIQVYDVAGGKNWKVNINGAPGVGGFEVYHPRWSNHPRYFVVTGPYEKGEGGNRIGGGGEKVEIYVGRFDEQAKKVEAWHKATNNRRADFYPDLWIEGGEKVQLADNIASSAGPAKVAGWPARPDRLVYIWEDMKASNQPPKNSPVGFYQCNIEMRGRALHTSHLQFAAGGGWGETGEAGKKIGQALARSNKATVEFLLTPESKQKGTILFFSGGKKQRLALEQDGKALIVSSGSGGSTLKWAKVLTPGKSQHLVVTFGEGKVELFKDGKSLGKKQFDVDFKNQPIDTFGLGDLRGSWKGILENIAVYDEPLSPETVVTNSRIMAEKSKTRSSVTTLAIEGKLADTTEIPAPDSIGAYRRALVVNTYSVEKVVDGKYVEDRIMVAEWAVLDRKIIKEYHNPVKTEQLNLQKFDDHPELEGERQMMDIFEPDLEMYYRLPGNI